MKRGFERLFRVEVHSLRKISNSQIGARGNDSPRIGLFESSKDAHERCFAAAIGADESRALVVADAEGDVFKDWLDAVGFRNVVSSKHNNLLRPVRPQLLKTKTEGKPSAVNASSALARIITAGGAQKTD
jgi:hypothetical protein